MSPVIVAIHPSDELYGADRVLLDVVSRLRLHDRVEVWLPTDIDYPHRALSSILQDRGIGVRHCALPVLRRAYFTPRGLLAVSARTTQFAAQLRKARPNSLYVNTSALAPAVPVAAMLGIPTTLHIHETWGPLERRVLTGMCHPADQVVVVGESTRLALSKGLRQRATIRRHRVEAPPMDPAAVAQVRAAVNAGGLPVVLFAGRWTPGKGIREFLEALATTPLHAIILGGPPPSGANVDAVAEVGRLDMGDRVHVVGEVDDVWPYIYACDAVAVPSVGPESYPTIALEAIAAGRPVLASATGGLREIVTPNVGVLLPAGDSAAWRAALMNMLPGAPVQQ